MTAITKDLCVYCLCKSHITKKTTNYIVGLCEKHQHLNESEIDDILGIKHKQNENLRSHKLQ